MNTAIEISTELFEKVKQRSLESGQTLTSIVEQGLKMVLGDDSPQPPFKLSMLRPGNKSLGDPTDAQLITEILYEE